MRQRRQKFPAGQGDHSAKKGRVEEKQQEVHILPTGSSLIVRMDESVTPEVSQDKVLPEVQDSEIKDAQENVAKDSGATLITGSTRMAQVKPIGGLAGEPSRIILKPQITAVTLIPADFKAKRGQAQRLEGDVDDKESEHMAMVHNWHLRTRPEAQKPRVPISHHFEMFEGVMAKHLRPLFIQGRLDGIPFGRIFIDNGSTLNLMPSHMLPKLGKTMADLIPTQVILANFSGQSEAPLGILPVAVTVGKAVSRSAFFIVEKGSDFTALLGRDWIHNSWCVPSTLHQCLILWNGEEMETVYADERPFAVGANFADAPLYDDAIGPLSFEMDDSDSTTLALVVNGKNTWTAESFGECQEVLNRPKTFRPETL